MPIPLVNSVVSWFLKKRIHQIEFFTKYPNEVQHELLFNLLQSAKDTIIGKQYGFESIRTYEDFIARVPVISYEDMEPLIDQSRKGDQQLFWESQIRWFAKSSGTTNAKSKFIPVSQESLDECHYKGSKDLLCLYLNNNEESKLFRGKGLRLGGSKELYQENGTVFGDLSAILIDNMPFWAECSSTPSSKVSLMDNWETKLQEIVDETIKENVTSLAGVPSWMLVLLNQVLETTKNTNLLEVWENLEVYFHGGVSFEPYKDQYKKLLPNSNFKYYEIYNASEGFFAIQDRNDSSELLLMLDYGIFYEFAAMETYGTSQQKLIPLSEVVINVNYAVIITTNAGLWRYKIGDTIRFTSITPYRIKVTGRTKHHINAFGEELMIENTDKALKIACVKTNSEIKEYTAAPIFMVDKKKGAHEWLIEFKREPENLDYFSELLDNALKSLNSDYEAKRFNNITLSHPKIHKAKKNLFYDWLKNKSKLGGQNKIARLSNSRNFIEELLKNN
jgi:hypothetical protein